jgi:hypothetical protein
MLKPYLEHAPSEGSQRLAALIAAQYFDVILTFNFDSLVEKSLNAISFSDFSTIIRGPTVDAEMKTLVEAREPRVKLVKLHGSLRSSHHFLFALDEMFKYPEPIEALIKEVTARDIIVCGYGFRDICVVRAFAEQGGTIVCVDAGGVPANLRKFLRDRKSEQRAIQGDFDRFFSELHRELLEPKAPAPARRSAPNPFKFLESYEQADADSFMGRDNEIADFHRALEREPPRCVVIVAGPGKAGKTSLAKAGLLARLDPAKYLGMYLRCPREGRLEPLPRELRRLIGGDDPAQPEDADLPATLRWVTERAKGRRVVLVLDQFERVAAGLDLETEGGKRDLDQFLGSQLFPACGGKLTLVPVVDSVEFPLLRLTTPCNRAGIPYDVVECEAFERQAVADIIRELARKGGVEFDGLVMDEMIRKYEDTRKDDKDKRFTLAHIQAICHILVSSGRTTHADYRTAFENNLAALNAAINQYDIISFVEDCPFPDTVWLRNMIKVPLRENKERIAWFIKEHYTELLPPQRAPGAGPARPAVA